MKHTLENFQSNIVSIQHGLLKEFTIYQQEQFRQLKQTKSQLAANSHLLSNYLETMMISFPPVLHLPPVEIKRKPLQEIGNNINGKNQKQEKIDKLQAKKLKSVEAEKKSVINQKQEEKQIIEKEDSELLEMVELDEDMEVVEEKKSEEEAEFVEAIVEASEALEEMEVQAEEVEEELQEAEEGGVEVEAAEEVEEVEEGEEFEEGEIEEPDEMNFLTTSPKNKKSSASSISEIEAQPKFKSKKFILESDDEESDEERSKTPKKSKAKQSKKGGSVSPFGELSKVDDTFKITPSILFDHSSSDEESELASTASTQLCPAVPFESAPTNKKLSNKTKEKEFEEEISVEESSRKIEEDSPRTPKTPKTPNPILSNNFFGRFSHEEDDNAAVISIDNKPEPKKIPPLESASKTLQSLQPTLKEFHKKGPSPILSKTTSSKYQNPGNPFNVTNVKMPAPLLPSPKTPCDVFAATAIPPHMRIEMQHPSSYEITPPRPGASSDTDSDSDDSDKLDKIPLWARKENLAKQIAKQMAENPDPTTIFPFQTTCDLEAMFASMPPPKAKKGGRKRDLTKRGSSANWAKDKITPQEEELYKQKMGFYRANLQV